MNDIKIWFRNKIFDITVDFPTSIFLYQRFGYFYIQVSGIDGNNVVHRWIDEKIELGESIEFQVIDNLDKSVSSKPIETKKAFADNSPLSDSELHEMYIQQLEKFNRLEEFLKKEGLID